MVNILTFYSNKAVPIKRNSFYFVIDPVVIVYYIATPCVHETLCNLYPSAVVCSRTGSTYAFGVEAQDRRHP